MANAVPTQFTTDGGDNDPLKGLIPTSRYTPEELKATTLKDWSKPCRTFRTRYLLNKIAKKLPLTDIELDILMPPIQREQVSVKW